MSKPRRRPCRRTSRRARSIAKAMAAGSPTWRGMELPPAPTSMLGRLGDYAKAMIFGTHKTAQVILAVTADVPLSRWADPALFDEGRPAPVPPPVAKEEIAAALAAKTAKAAAKRLTEKLEEKPADSLPKADRAYKPRVFALPEVLPGELGAHWNVRSDARMRAGIDKARKRMVAPSGVGPIEHAIRLQQVARIKWDDPAVDLESFGDSLLCRAVEDHRLGLLLSQTGVDIDAGFMDAQAFSDLAKAPGDAAFLAFLLMSDNTGMNTQALCEEHANEKPVKLFRQVRERIRSDPSKQNAHRIIKWLRTVVTDSKQLGSFPGQCNMGNGQNRGSGSGSEMVQDEWWDLAWEDCEEDDQLQNIPPAVRERLPTDVPPEVQRVLNDLGTDEIELSQWGEMAVEEPARVHTVRGSFHKKWKSTEEGVFPRYHHRLFQDGRVFARRHRVPGGTVVIDASGSMGLSGPAIQKIVERAPGCVVACYSGTGPNGVLRILAKNGQRVGDAFCSSPHGGGNIVDYPALKWAYKLAHPRIWVSDFGVTGINDVSGSANLVMCAAVVKKGRFFTARNTAEADKLLGQLGKYYRKHA